MLTQFVNDYNNNNSNNSNNNNNNNNNNNININNNCLFTNPKKESEKEIKEVIPF